MRFGDSFLVMVNSLSISLLASLDNILWEVSSGFQSQSSSRTYLRSSFLAVLIFSLMVRDEDLVSESILEWCSDAHQDGKKS